MRVRVGGGRRSGSGGRSGSFPRLRGDGRLGWCSLYRLLFFFFHFLGRCCPFYLFGRIQRRRSGWWGWCYRGERHRHHRTLSIQQDIQPFAHPSTAVKGVKNMMTLVGHRAEASNGIDNSCPMLVRPLPLLFGVLRVVVFFFASTGVYWIPRFFPSWRGIRRGSSSSSSSSSSYGSGQPISFVSLTCSSPPSNAHTYNKLSIHQHIMPTANHTACRSDGFNNPLFSSSSSSSLFAQPSRIACGRFRKEGDMQSRTTRPP